jgi:hypothetical protein
MDNFRVYIQSFAWLNSLLTIVAAVVIAVLVKRRAQKSFTYRVLTDLPLVSRHAKSPGKLEVLYDKQPVDNIRVVEIELKNSGGVPIKEEDFKEKITLGFGNYALFEDSVESTHPKGLKAELFFGDMDSKTNSETKEIELFILKSVELGPLMLNAGDSIVIKLLTDAPETCKVTVSGRIEGVSAITEKGAGNLLSMRQKRHMFAIGYGVMAFSGVMSIRSKPVSFPHEYPLALTINAVYVVICLTLVGYYFLYYGRNLEETTGTLTSNP